MEELKKNFPEGLDYSIVYDPTRVRARLDQGGGPHAAGSDRAGRAGRDPVPADLARLDHSAAGGAGLDRRHVRARCICSASRSTRCRCSAWCWPSASWSTTPSWWWRTSSATSKPGLHPREATLQAMSEVTGPIIAIALVLCAVFVPIAFISGLTGEFYRQFALTIAFSTVISAFNSLTLSPALAALLLKGHDAPKDALARGMDKRARAVLQPLQPRVPSRLERLWPRRRRHPDAQIRRAVGVYAVLLGRDRRCLPASCRPASCRCRTSNIWSASRNCRKAPRSTAPRK